MATGVVQRIGFYRAIPYRIGTPGATNTSGTINHHPQSYVFSIHGLDSFAGRASWLLAAKDEVVKSHDGRVERRSVLAGAKRRQIGRGNGEDDVVYVWRRAGRDGNDFAVTLKPGSDNAEPPEELLSVAERLTILIFAVAAKGSAGSGIETEVRF